MWNQGQRSIHQLKIKRLPSKSLALFWQLLNPLEEQTLREKKNDIKRSTHCDFRLELHHRPKEGISSRFAFKLNYFFRYSNKKLHWPMLTKFPWEKGDSCGLWRNLYKGKIEEKRLFNWLSISKGKWRASSWASLSRQVLILMKQMRMDSALCYFRVNTRLTLGIWFDITFSTYLSHYLTYIIWLPNKQGSA